MYAWANGRQGLGRRIAKLVKITPAMWKWLYLVIATPTVLALCLLTGPFQVPDEPAHFLKISQLVNGGILPLSSADHTSAGGLVDQGAAALAERYADFDRNHTVTFNLPTIDALFTTPKSNVATFASFSNTAIYFPLSYLIPGLAVAPLEAIGAPPLSYGSMLDGLQTHLQPSL